MKYTANIEGFEGQNIEVKNGFWTGPKLFVNGAPFQIESKQGGLILQRNDGKQVIVNWKPQSLGLDVPKLNVDGKTISLVDPLKWYQWVWVGWPVILIAIGGLLGAIAGMVAFSINTKIFRSKMNNGLKYVVSGVVSILLVIAYYIAAVIITQFIKR
jgi:hypothetical protein